MPSSLEPRPPRVLISGASRGFGAALSQAFAERGARVFAGSRGARPRLAPSLEAFSALVTAVELDVQSLDSISRARSAVAQHVDALDIVVNNAAIRSATVSNELPEVDFEDAKL